MKRVGRRDFQHMWRDRDDTRAGQIDAEVGRADCLTQALQDQLPGGLGVR
jgi:hypothetical protein